LSEGTFQHGVDYSRTVRVLEKKAISGKSFIALFYASLHVVSVLAFSEFLEKSAESGGRLSNGCAKLPPGRDRRLENEQF
jgi:hypothetical protein